MSCRRYSAASPAFWRCMLVLAAASLLWPPQAGLPAGGSAFAQTRPVTDTSAPEPPPKPPFPPEAKPLLDPDTGTWMAGVAALRDNPRGHDILIQALQSQPNNPRRWRLPYHLLEWGGPSDLSVVEDLLEEATGRDRVELSAAMGALYPRPLAPVDLARVVSEFAFIPQDAPQPFAPGTAGRWVLNDLALQSYHLDGLPIRLIERVATLRGRSYDSRGALADALQKTVQGRQWADFGERLLSPIYPVPARVSESGILQIRLANPEQRPIVLILNFQCWYGRFENVPPAQYVIVQGGQTVLKQIPVKLIAPVEPGRARIFMRIQEENVPGVLDAQKLEVAMRR